MTNTMNWQDGTNTMTFWQDGDDGPTHCTGWMNGQPFDMTPDADTMDWMHDHAWQATFNGDFHFMGQCPFTGGDWFTTN